MSLLVLFNQPSITNLSANGFLQSEGATSPVALSSIAVWGRQASAGRSTQNITSFKAARTSSIRIRGYVSANAVSQIAAQGIQATTGQSTQSVTGYGAAYGSSIKAQGAASANIAAAVSAHGSLIGYSIGYPSPIVRIAALGSLIERAIGSPSPIVRIAATSKSILRGTSTNTATSRVSSTTLNVLHGTPAFTATIVLPPIYMRGALHVTGRTGITTFPVMSVNFILDPPTMATIIPAKLPLGVFVDFKVTG